MRPSYLFTLFIWDFCESCIPTSHLKHSDNLPTIAVHRGILFVTKNSLDDSSGGEGLLKDQIIQSLLKSPNTNQVTLNVYCQHDGPLVKKPEDSVMETVGPNAATTQPSMLLNSFTMGASSAKHITTVDYKTISTTNASSTPINKTFTIAATTTSSSNLSTQFYTTTIRSVLTTETNSETSSMISPTLALNNRTGNINNANNVLKS